MRDIPLIRPTFATINLTHLVHNYHAVRRVIPPTTTIVGVVKANGYGHGSVEVARALHHAGITYLGVATIEEGILLRNHGITCSILVLGSVYPYASFSYLAEYRLIPTISSVFLARKYSAYARRKGKRLPLHVKVDTGMGRIGMSVKRAHEYIETIVALPNLCVDGVYSHLAHTNDTQYTRAQIERFSFLKHSLAHHTIPYFHLANSAGIFHYAHTLSEYQMVRPGLSLYGLFTPPIDKKIILKPVLSLKSNIVFLKTVPRGTGISYNHTYITHKRMVVATIPIGYADGYDRMLSNSAEAIIRGKRVPQIGRICMDMCMFDVTNVPGVDVGDEVTLIGKVGNEEITVHDIAQQMSSINYEVVCQISARVPRVYVR